MGIASDLILIIVASLACAMIAKRLGQPLIIGYIAAGILLGPYTGNLIVSEAHDIEMLAEIGVGLLLFVLGIEFSLNELKPVKKVALIGGPLQILATIGFGYGLGRLLGMQWDTAIWLGAFFSLSSTMVVLKTLESQGVMGTLSSRVMIGMLIVQDLALVPLIIILPQLGDLEAGVAALGLAALKSAAFLAIMLIAGRTVIPRLMRRIALKGSREMFLLSVCALGLGIGYVTHMAGLSFAFGAFMAGLLLSESDYSYQVVSHVLPLRDIFGLIFFASVGMLLDPHIILQHPLTIGALVLALLLGKGLIFYLITLAFGYRNIVPIATALTMFQVGELSFLMARFGMEAGAISPDQFAIFLPTAVISMMVTPVLARFAPYLYGIRQKMRYSPPFESFNMGGKPLSGHVVIVGGGTIGTVVAEMIRQFGSRYVVIENDFRAVEKLKNDGHPAIYGDATTDVVLEAAHLDKAAQVLITTPDFSTSRATTTTIRLLSPNIPLIGRSAGMEEMKQLASEGMDIVVQAQMEVGLEFVRQALVNLGVPAGEISDFSENIHRDHYKPLVDASSCQDIPRIARTADRILGLNWVHVQPDSALDNKSIGEAQVRKETGVSIVALLRNDHMDVNPEADTNIHSGDLLAVIGNPDQVQLFRKWLSAKAPETAII